MRDVIYLGQTPPEEECVQLGEPGYHERARKNCEAYAELVRHKFGPEPEGARLRVLSQSHDFGSYLELVAEFEVGDAEAERYALACDWMGPADWNDTEPYDWRGFGRKT